MLRLRLVCFSLLLPTLLCNTLECDDVAELQVCRKPTDEQWDYIIVGAGSAGSVLAGKLARAGKRTLLLERGPDADWRGQDQFGWADTKDPNDWGRLQEFSDINPGGGPTGEACDRAELVGGCSSINAMIWLRGSPHLYDKWAKITGSREWSAACIMPRFDRMENSTAIPGAHPPPGGVSGPVILSAPQWGDSATQFVRFMMQHGHPYNANFNGRSQEGVGPWPLSKTPGANSQRVSLADAYLDKDVRALPNFRLLTGSLVQKIHLKGKRKRAFAVTYKNSSGHVVTVRTARKGEIIVSGGAYRSPQLLMVSGIGPKDILKSIGVEVVHELDGVGKGLTDHMNVIFGGPQVVPGLHDQSGVSPELGHGAIFKSELCKSRGCDIPDLQIAMASSGLTAGILNMPESKGRVYPVSADMEQQVAVKNNQLTSPDDIQRLGELWRIGQELRGENTNTTCTFVPAYHDKHWTQMLFRNPFLAAAWLTGAVKPAFSTWHPCCTCRMGRESDEEAVVDAQLRVRGVTSLRIADASIFPVIPNSNTNAPAAVVGATLADMLLGTTCVASAWAL